MKPVFAGVSLLVALAVVALLSARQLKAVRPADAAASQPAAAGPADARRLEQAFQHDLPRALQQSADERASEAER